MQDSTLKIAIIRLSSLGDIITSLVFVEFLRRSLSDSAGRKIEIAFVVDSAFRAIVEDSLLIDKIIDLPLRAAKKDKKLIFAIIKKVRNLWHFDMVIDAQGLIKTAIVGKCMQKRQFIGFDKDSIREKIASFFYDKKAQIPYNEHILKRQYELFKVAFLPYCQMPDEFDLAMLDSRHKIIGCSKKAKDKIATLLAPFAKNRKILFILETSKKHKNYPLESFLNLALAIKGEIDSAKIFLIWDKDESAIAEFGKSDEIFCVLPHLDFDEIKALLGSMDLVIGGDTGITHCAWALKIPSITIYISTNINRFKLDGERHFSHSLHSSCDSTQPLDSTKFTKELMTSVKKALR